jgi:GMP synthase (glutamine-hydrolysing)
VATASLAAPPARRVLLVDAVNWSSAYPTGSPFRDVLAWYARWFAPPTQVRWSRVGAEDDLDQALAQRPDGVVLSGSPRDAWSDDPVNDRLIGLVQRCREQPLPFLGVCYGHQILGRACGGRVGRHPKGLELGNTPVELTEAGKGSPLFAGFTPRFDVLSSHADALFDLPPGAELLARGDFTEIQAFQAGDRLFGVQFHPETDPDTLRFLWKPRRESWQPRVRFDLDAVLADLRPTPLAAQVLHNFVTHIIP